MGVTPRCTEISNPTLPLRKDEPLCHPSGQVIFIIMYF